MNVHLYWPFVAITPTLLVLNEGQAPSTLPYELLVARNGAAFVRMAPVTEDSVYVLETAQRVDLAGVGAPWTFARHVAEIALLQADLPLDVRERTIHELFVGLLLYTEGLPRVDRWREILAEIDKDLTYAQRLHRDLVSSAVSKKPWNELRAQVGQFMALCRDTSFLHLRRDYQDELL